MRVCAGACLCASFDHDLNWLAAGDCLLVAVYVCRLGYMRIGWVCVRHVGCSYTACIKFKHFSRVTSVSILPLHHGSCY